MKKYDLKTIGLITTFEKITRTNVKTIFIDKNSQVIFIVNEGDAGKAIGKGGKNIKKFSYLAKKKIKVIEFNPEVKEFIKNCIEPLKVDSVEKEGKIVTLHAKSRQTRAMLIGRNKENLIALSNIIRKYFDVEITVKE